MSNKIKFRLFSVFSIVILCIGFTIRQFQNDTFYVIKLGDYIFNHGIDLKDHWCWITNLSYTYPHWLYDLIIYFIYRFFSYSGVYISTVILFIVLILFIYFINLYFNKNELMALIISILSIANLFGFATARAQLLSAILLLLEVYFIERLIKNGNNRYIFYLCLISLLIANIHATIWLVCFVFYLPYIAEHVVYMFKNSKFINKLRMFNIKFVINSSSNKLIVNNINNIKKIVIAFILSFIMGVFTPSRICYTYVLRIMMGDSQKYITEHAPLVLLHEPVFLISICIVVLILSFTSVKIKLRELLMIVGLSFMCLTAVRHIALFTIIGMLFVSIICCRFFEVEHDNTFDVIYNILVKNNIIYVFLFLLALGIGGSQFYKNSKEDYVSFEKYPVKAVKYIKDNLNYKDIHLYNEYNVGSYLLFNDIPVFVDSRCDLYLTEFNGLNYNIFDDVMTIESNYRKKFAIYDVSHVLVSNDSFLYSILNVDSDYVILYSDKYYTLFEMVDGYEEY